MTFRKILFWLHLIAGCIAGTIILVMSATGLLLTYERQILARADRGAYQISNPPSSRLSIDDLLTRMEGELTPNSSLVIRSNPSEPVEISLGREGAVYASPYDGRVLGRSDPETRRFFQSITSWHRWLGADGEGRATAKAITGACNLAFLFIVASGIYLWLPKVWSRQHLRPIVWFRSNSSGKARDFNWHNVFGFWTAIPLLIVVASAVPMSYSWGNRLLYQMTGSEIPTFNGPPGEKGGGKGKAGPRKKRGGPPSEQREDRPMEREERRPSLNAPWTRAQQQVAGWKSISLRIPNRPSADVVFTIDTGDGGQPQKRSTLTLDPANAAVRKWETFDSTSPGRQLRSWTRFAHTGEYYGIVGQTIAGVACFAALMLVWTGIALALRRFAAWRTRRSAGIVVAASR